MLSLTMTVSTPSRRRWPCLSRTWKSQMEDPATPQRVADVCWSGSGWKFPRRYAAVTLLAVGTVTYLLYSTESQYRPDLEEFMNVHNFNNGRYLVRSPSCRIPDVDPYHESIRHLLKPAEPIVCSSDPPLSYTTRLPDGSRALRLRPSARGRRCCYSAVTRYTVPADVVNDHYVDDYYNISSCKRLRGWARLSSKEQFVLVQCDEVFVNAHAVVVPTEEVRRRVVAAASSSQQRPSVLLFGVDSMSRLNLARTMPRTSALLRRSGWIELDGYNKVADNTFPNIMAILTGLSLKQIKKVCWKTQYTVYDNCPFIWKDYQRQGYITVYAEDEPPLATFNSHKAGFRVQPTDYYIRPFMFAAMDNLQTKKRNDCNICVGPLPTAEYMFRYTIDFATTFQNALYFALIWLNNFSHNNHITPAAMDDRTMQMFKELIETSVLNNTVAVFFSDHGVRVGELRETVVGWLEERLPFIYIWVPEWFRKKYPDSFVNLSSNKNRLTSPYDLHATLRDILKRSKSNTALVKTVNLACPLCKSLFSEIPYDRKCEDAGITPHWCTCSEYKPLLQNNSILLKCAQHAVFEIGLKLKTVNSESKILCSELRLKRIVEGRSKSKDSSSTQVADYDDYIVVFETEPGNALLEATVRHFPKGRNFFSVMGTISRLNSYANQSKCITDSQLKLYCYCPESKL